MGESRTSPTDAEIRAAYRTRSVRNVVLAFYLTKRPVSLYRVRKVLGTNLRGTGGGTKLRLESELAHRREVAATVWTWKDYGEKLGLRSPRNDHRLGVNLLCFRCHTRVSTTTARMNGVRRQVCSPCARILKRISG